MPEPKIFNVKKRNKVLVPFQIEKINKILSWAIEGISGVSISDIEMHAKINLIEGISTREIHNLLIESAINLFNEEFPNYQHVAGRLLNYQLRKDVWGGKNPPKLYDVIKTNIDKGVYHKEILDFYSKQEIDKLDEKINHDRDYLFTYSGIKQLCDKYLIQNRKSKEIHETPQFAYMCAAMVAFQSYPKETRINTVKRAYDAFSKFKINLPTPQMAGIRSHIKQYASCCLIDVDDTKESIFSSNTAAGFATTQRYGIGLNFGRIRGIGTEINKGSVIHTGVIPFLKVFESTVKRAYDAFSKFKINLPTPQMAGIRSHIKQYASCCLIDVDDTKESIFSSNTAAGFATTQRYGIGLNFGRIRGIGTEINKGSVIHTGVIPFLKVFESTVKSCQQNGIRGGGATVNFPFWHYEIEDIMVLKNNGGTEDNRVRKLDYVIQFSKLFYERFKNQEDITLFSPHEVLELTESFGLPQFDDLYLKYESDPNIKYKRKIKATDLMSLLVKERTETGRIYIMNIDHCNEHGSFKDRVAMTNLCVEVTHPTKPLQHIDDPNGEIGICVLSAINILEIKDEQDLQNTCDIIVRMLDELIDYQKYFTKAAENFTKNRRSLGIGITNLAALLAKNNLKYTDKEAPNFVDELMEKIQYYLTLASTELAKEKGACKDFDKTKYSNGILPIDTYKKKVDSIVSRKPTMPWEELRKNILQHGMRHSTLTALMPCESSSVIQNSTNGIEPPRSLLTYKGSKANSVPVIVPLYNNCKNKYTLQFDMKDNIGYMNIVAALQKWVDMSISSNLYYNYEHYDNKSLPDSKIIKEILYAYSIGIKTLYYSNTYDGDKQSAVDTEKTNNCSSGACSI